MGGRDCWTATLTVFNEEDNIKGYSWLNVLVTMHIKTDSLILHDDSREQNLRNKAFMDLVYKQCADLLGVDKPIYGFIKYFAVN